MRGSSLPASGTGNKACGAGGGECAPAVRTSAQRAHLLLFGGQGAVGEGSEWGSPLPLRACFHLSRQMLVAGGSSNLQQVRFHAASSLASLLATQGRTQQARGLLRGKLEATTHHSYWHIRFLLQLGVGLL